MQASQLDARFQTEFADRRLAALTEKLSASLRDRCVAALPGSRIAVAPHQYTICAAAPGPGETGSTGWRQLPVLAAGTGREPMPG